MAKRVLIIFLDGVGLGEANAEVNPFMHVKMARLKKWLGASQLTREAAGSSTELATLLAVDAQLGVPGLPQSGTGQTAILTGLNAPEANGGHYGPYPNRNLRDMLATHSLFKTLHDMGHPVAYANAYPDRFLDRIRRGKGRTSANTNAAVMAGLRLRSRRDLERGRAVPAMLHNEFWPETDVELPALNASQAGEQLAALAQDYLLTFFEFWYSDWIGHKMDRDQSIWILEQLDQFIAAALENVDLNETLVLVVSDHGNFEDWTTKKHTGNPSLAIVAGRNAGLLAPQLKALTDIKPVVSSYIFE
ncbi:MAG TPA: alkaline phosphatase family protein [Anaerolineae bacterium]|nr:alkaline phosphatase family protein [Anaerolineae bacterium]MCB0223215.1 alkaline phosphatase family protein [Anaerolineae bacterium]MCB9105049.1 alkaline phosphatase family protein [Anaerolineales bacterium]HRV94830.1 alkaline phosphatase family protein [Anaerolineae bacterium]